MAYMDSVARTRRVSTHHQQDGDTPPLLSPYSSTFPSSPTVSTDPPGQVTIQLGAATGLRTRTPAQSISLPPGQDFTTQQQRYDHVPPSLARTTSTTTTPTRANFVITEPTLPLSQRLRRASINVVTNLSQTLSNPDVYINSTKRLAKFVWKLDPSLILAFTTSIAFTISQKTLLRTYFPYRWTLLACQQGCATLAMTVLKTLSWHRPPKLSKQNERVIKLVAILFTIEQLTAIVSLQLVSIPFHLSVRALAPLVTLLISILFFKQNSTWRALCSFLVVILGVTLTSHSIPDIHSFGSLLTFSGMLLSSTKSLVTTRVLQQRFDLQPLDIVAKTNPITLLHATLIALLNGELLTIWKFLLGPDCTTTHVLHIVMNAVLSFSMVVFNMLADRRTVAPSLAISNHSSQAVTILVAVLVFQQTLSIVNLVGVGLTLGGGVLYAVNDALDQQITSTNSKLLPD
ncbi:hypothetical protein OIO90_001677 [Microbotryomycetes sp. JL221]|nr:hypothetical protein OIO90_001677 [Microbotryomycetes sp. JL221]